MKSWFARFRISAALDAGAPAPGSMREKMAGSSELRRFAETTAMLDRALEGGPPLPEPAPALHASIMRVVRAASVPAPTTSRAWSLARWLAAPVCAAILVLGGWHLLRQPAAPSPLAHANTALAMGRQIAQTAPSTLLAPLSDEWEKINLDLSNTAQFLLANLP